MQIDELNFCCERSVLDANVGVGDRRELPSPVRDADQLLAEMDRHGVDRALVYPLQGEQVSALDGNDQLHEWIDAGQHRLLPLWMASMAPESMRQLQQLHSSVQVQAIRLHDTASTSIPLTAWIYGDLLEWLQAEDIPLWVSLADNDPVQLADTFGQFRELRIVLVGAHYSHAAYLLPLLRHLPRAYLELSRHESLGAIEELVTQVGARRLLYGSFYPRYAMGPVLWGLHRQQIEPGSLQRILDGTALELLGMDAGQDAP
jgi:predicted TIM-barrel fold metal-dependent hydrolase